MELGEKDTKNDFRFSDSSTNHLGNAQGDSISVCFCSS